MLVGFALPESQQREYYNMHQRNVVELVEMEVVELEGVQMEVV